MRKVLAVGCFVIGCLVVAGATSWLIAALSGDVRLPSNPAERFLAVAGFIVWGVVLIVTLDRYTTYKYPALLRVTPVGIGLARMVLAVLAAVFLISVVATYFDEAPSSKWLVWKFGSLFLLTGSYISLHWAFRPENIFASNILSELTNPGLLLPVLRWMGLRKSSESRQDLSDEEDQPEDDIDRGSLSKKSDRDSRVI